MVNIYNNLKKKKEINSLLIKQTAVIKFYASEKPENIGKNSLNLAKVI